jgi:hypothetical protein
MDKKDLQLKQINSTSQLCAEFESDCESTQEKIDTLRSLLRIKEMAARKLEEIFITQIMPLGRIGISDLSVLGIAEALENELVTNLGEMEVIADRLALVTHNNDIRDGYGIISERILSDVAEMLERMKETREQAVNDDGTLQKVEWGDMWENLNEEIRRIIS